MRTALLVACLLAPVLAPAGTYPLSGEEWASPRSAGAVLGWPAVRSAVAEWRAAPELLLVIQHADEEEALLRAAELRDWLISLGIPPAALRLSAGPTGNAALLLQVELPAAPDGAAR